MIKGGIEENCIESVRFQYYMFSLSIRTLDPQKGERKGDIYVFFFFFSSFPFFLLFEIETSSITFSLNANDKKGKKEEFYWIVFRCCPWQNDIIIRVTSRGTASAIANANVQFD